MVNFPDLSKLSDNPTIGNVLSLPNASYPYFWAWIIAGIWVIISLALYFNEKEKTGVKNLLSCMSTACYAILILSLVGTMIGFITLEIMIYIVVFCLIIIVAWIYSSER